ncbi:RidA family protein [Nocardia pseudobrasiliensis]|uniref:Enamine deaminase RidA (YjgF/YER057c/UK114 family) n=1 Tax=Nocardia pseudobrasiliensis TaxID=45979 RepID=A0A370IB28_9NOCA|nr:RidA family protein [Nocardia pseudobrasiliensis]RDI66604.1 enamine deaminase RidA (YjgF/YER057c/UK114 family) [Nocardia pseudobrasiliensis]
MSVTYINPGDLPTNPAYSQAVRVPAGADILYIGGQNGVDGSGRLVGPDLKSQARQALANVRSCLSAAGADLEHIVKWSIFIKEGEPLLDGFAAFQEVWGERENPPAISGFFVSALAVPGALVEIEAVAAIPAD